MHRTAAVAAKESHRHSHNFNFALCRTHDGDSLRQTTSLHGEALHEVMGGGLGESVSEEDGEQLLEGVQAVIRDREVSDGSESRGYPIMPGVGPRAAAAPVNTRKPFCGD